MRSAAWRAEQPHHSGEGTDAIAEAGQPGAAPVGAAYTVVPHSQVKELPALLYRDLHDGGLGVLSRIREGLTDYVVGAGLDRIGQSASYLHVQLRRDGRAAGQGFHGGTETALGKDGGMESAGDFPDVFHRFPEAFLDMGQFAFQFLVTVGD
jgi:hypothetical protein